MTAKPRRPPVSTRIMTLRGDPLSAARARHESERRAALRAPQAARVQRREHAGQREREDGQQAVAAHAQQQQQQDGHVRPRRPCVARAARQQRRPGARAAVRRRAGREPGAPESPKASSATAAAAATDRAPAHARQPRPRARGCTL